MRSSDDVHKGSTIKSTSMLRMLRFVKSASQMAKIYPSTKVEPVVRVESTIERINADYPRHARLAHEIAREHFDAARVLPRLIEEACA